MNTTLADRPHSAVVDDSPSAPLTIAQAAQAAAAHFGQPGFEGVSVAEIAQDLLGCGPLLYLIPQSYWDLVDEVERAFGCPSTRDSLPVWPAVGSALGREVAAFEQEVAECLPFTPPPCVGVDAFASLLGHGVQSLLVEVVEVGEWVRPRGGVQVDDVFAEPALAPSVFELEVDALVDEVAAVTAPKLAAGARTVDAFAPRVMPSKPSHKTTPKRIRKEGKGLRRSAEEEGAAFQERFLDEVGPLMGRDGALDLLRTRFEQFLARGYVTSAVESPQVPQGLRVGDVRQYWEESFGGLRPWPPTWTEVVGDTCVVTPDAYAEMQGADAYRGLVVFATRMASPRFASRELQPYLDVYEAWITEYLRASYARFLRTWARQWESLGEGWRPAADNRAVWDWSGDTDAEDWIVKATTKCDKKIASAVKEQRGYSRDLNQMSPAYRICRRLRADWCEANGLRTDQRIPRKASLLLAVQAYAVARRDRVALAFAQNGRVEMGTPDAGEIFAIAETVERASIQGTHSAVSLDAPLDEGVTTGDFIAAPQPDMVAEGSIQELIPHFFKRVKAANPVEDYAYLYYSVAAAAPAEMRRGPLEFAQALGHIGDAAVEYIHEIADRLLATFEVWAWEQGFEIAEAHLEALHEVLVAPTEAGGTVFGVAMDPPDGFSWGARLTNTNAFHYRPTFQSPAEERAFREALHDTALSTQHDKDVVISEMGAEDRAFIEESLPRYLALAASQTKAWFQESLEALGVGPVAFTNEGVVDIQDVGLRKQVRERMKEARDVGDATNGDVSEARIADFERHFIDAVHELRQRTTAPLRVGDVATDPTLVAWAVRYTNDPANAA